MEEIKLTKGFVAQVDDSDYDYLNQWEWHASVKPDGHIYAMRSVRYGARRGCVYMHRLIMDTPIDMEVDHINHDTLNCQRINMRNCSRLQNAMNRRAYGKSKYLGVSYNSKNNINAFIKKGNYHKNLGIFKTEIEAALAYDEKAKELFGEFANLNFK